MSTLETDLRRVVRGRVHVPGDETFETARLPWNRAVDQRVRAVVEIEDAADAAVVVRHAALAGLAVAAQPGGHGATTDLDGTILVRTGRLRGVEVDPERRVARVEAGVQWGELLTATGKHGLTGLPGSSPVVSVVGYTLGGGLSWFARRYGWAADSVRAFETIGADGVPARVTADSDADLFWALRGGGGDFALVTAVELDLHPAPRLYGGRMLWPADRAPELLAAFREVTAGAPAELTVWFTMVRFPPVPQVPEPLRGLAAVAVDTTFLGDEEEGRALLRRFEDVPGVLLDSRAAMPLDALGGICAEPTHPVPGAGRGELLTGLDDVVAGDLLAALGDIAPLASVQVRHLGGALRRPAPAGGACGHVAEPYLLGMIGPIMSPEGGRAVHARLAEIARSMAPHTTGRKPFTYLHADETAASAFDAETLARLREIKRRRDPHGVFRSNKPVSAQS
ncbi:FAD-binding oxidoreductase [Microbispora triticiradicis]|uniref:FAD-binding oxidoreductase n=3 Tax=Microbispora TaxID=2005 RepID=A0ABY3LTJ9_9ACTN|nr:MULTISPECIES: FAD-binding oxidoreductase [Microbispora]RGA01603.1 FAD-binding oxidoreductase [Microbispora triticiradicis]TLP58776.1 FAD-binding oxidoreductase [Microbispora fusca]TYB53853.1 FAD-binding oxidoreductase [Microbispora tritici]